MYLIYSQYLRTCDVNGFVVSPQPPSRYPDMIGTIPVPPPVASPSVYFFSWRGERSSCYCAYMNYVQYPQQLQYHPHLCPPSCSIVQNRFRRTIDDDARTNEIPGSQQEQLQPLPRAALPTSLPSFFFSPSRVESNRVESQLVHMYGTYITQNYRGEKNDDVSSSSLF